MLVFVLAASTMVFAAEEKPQGDEVITIENSEELEEKTPKLNLQEDISKEPEEDVVNEETNKQEIVEEAAEEKAIEEIDEDTVTENQGKSDKKKESEEEPLEELQEEELQEEKLQEEETPDEAIMTAEEKAAGKFLYPSIKLQANGVIENGDTISYTSYAKGGCRVFNSGKYTGSCCQAGTDPDASGQAKVVKQSNTSTIAKIAYQYGYKSGWNSNFNVISGFQSHTYAARFMHMVQMSQQGINTWNNWAVDNNFSSRVRDDSISHFEAARDANITVPSNFECFVCTPTNGRQKFMIYIYHQTSNFKIKKTTDFASLQGSYPATDVKFNVYTNAGCTTLAKTFDGNTTLSGLTLNSSMETATYTMNAGTYYVKEIDYPDYFETPSVKPVTLADGATATVVFENKYKKAKVKVKKTTDDPTFEADYPATGVTFTIYTDKECTTVAKNTSGTACSGLKLDSSLETAFSELVAGTYYIKEFNVPEYFEEPEVVSVTLLPKDEKTVTFQNKYRLIEVDIAKNISNPEAANGNALYSYVGTEFKLYKSANDAKAGTNSVGTLTIPANGKSNKVTLIKGNYYLVETKPGPGLLIPENLSSSVGGSLVDLSKSHTITI